MVKIGVLFEGTVCLLSVSIIWAIIQEGNEPQSSFIIIFLYCIILSQADSQLSLLHHPSFDLQLNTQKQVYYGELFDLSSIHDHDDMLSD